MRRWPELYFAAFAFVLNFIWEMLQMPLYTGVMQKPYSESVVICLLATAGDVAIMLGAFWLLALLAHSRHWVSGSDSKQVVQFTAIAFVIGIAAEEVAIKPLHSYSYNSRMPIVPVLGMGLVPLLQWILLPLAVFFLSKRQLKPRNRCGTE